MNKTSSFKILGLFAIMVALQFPVSYANATELKAVMPEPCADNQQYIEYQAIYRPCSPCPNYYNAGSNNYSRVRATNCDCQPYNIGGTSYNQAYIPYGDCNCPTSYYGGYDYGNCNNPPCPINYGYSNYGDCGNPCPDNYYIPGENCDCNPTMYPMNYGYSTYMPVNNYCGCQTYPYRTSNIYRVNYCQPQVLWDQPYRNNIDQQPMYLYDNTF